MSHICAEQWPTKDNQPPHYVGIVELTPTLSTPATPGCIDAVTPAASPLPYRTIRASAHLGQSSRTLPVLNTSGTGLLNTQHVPQIDLAHAKQSIGTSTHTEQHLKPLRGAAIDVQCFPHPVEHAAHTGILHTRHKGLQSRQSGAPRTSSAEWHKLHRRSSVSK